MNVPRGGGGLRIFHLNRYVIKRGPMGKLLELVIKEDAEWVALPDNIKELSDNPSDPDSHRDERVSIFTHVEYRDGFYQSSQEAFGKIIPGYVLSLESEKGGNREGIVRLADCSACLR